MTGDQIAATAARLRGAYGGRVLEPLRDVLGADDVKAAYSVQAANTRHWLAQGRRAVGHKIGLTSEAVQRQLGVDQPDFGVLFEDMQIADGGALAPSRVIQARAEAEIAIVLADDLDDPQVTRGAVAAATSHAFAAIEIVDSRIADWRISIADSVADNASAAFFVLGSEPKPLANLDLAACQMVMEMDGIVASKGLGAACLGHPMRAAAWLARELASRGSPLRAGQVVLTGALGPMVSLQPGTEVHVVIEGLGSVGFSFREDSR